MRISLFTFGIVACAGFLIFFSREREDVFLMSTNTPDREVASETRAQTTQTSDRDG